MLPASRWTTRLARSRAAPQLSRSFDSSTPSTPNCRAWRTRSRSRALSSMALVGMQPQFRHMPPTWSFSTRAVLRPTWPARMAAT